MFSPVDQATHIARAVDASLHQQGFTKKVQGIEQRVLIKSINVVPDRFVVIEIDTLNLPPRVALDKLMSNNTIHTLSTVLGGKEVVPVNHEGLLFVVRLDAGLPEMVALPTEEPPVDFAIPIGVSRAGPVWKSILDMGHMLVGGTTQSGKSTFLKSIIAYAGKNPLVEILVIDPKVVGFESVKQYVSQPIATTVEDAELRVAYVLKELERRKEMFKTRGIENYKQYIGTDKVIILVIDEFTTIALLAGLTSPFYTNLITLAAQAAAFGIHLILATQNPKAEVLNTLIRSNCDTRVCFRVSTASASNIVLDEGGADQIKNKGEFLFRLHGRTTKMKGYIYTTDPNSLTPLQKEMAVYAIEQLDGKFTLPKMYNQFKTKITQWQIQQMAELWESLGYLEKTGKGKTSPRVVTEVLRNLVQEST